MPAGRPVNVYLPVPSAVVVPVLGPDSDNVAEEPLTTPEIEYVAVVAPGTNTTSTK
jgi:hypothetical protein